MEEDSQTICTAIGCKAGAQFKSKRDEPHPFCSQGCADEFYSMIDGQITSNSEVYRQMEIIYNSYYDEDKDYNEFGFLDMTFQLTNFLASKYAERLGKPLDNVSRTSFETSLSQTRGFPKPERQKLIKGFIGSFMNFVHTLHNAYEAWTEKGLQDSTKVFLISLFVWATLPQGADLILHGLPNGVPFQPTILFRAPTRMSDRDPYINQTGVDYSATFIAQFPPELTLADRQAFMEKSGGRLLRHDVYTNRMFGSEADLKNLTFLQKVKDNGVKSILTWQHSDMRVISLAELDDAISFRKGYQPRYATWGS